MNYKIVEKTTVMGVSVTNTYKIICDKSEFSAVQCVCNQYQYLNEDYLANVGIGRKTKPIEMFDYKIGEKWYKANSETLHFIVSVLNGKIGIDNIPNKGFYRLVSESNVNDVKTNITLSKDFQKWRIEHVSFDPSTMEIREVKPQKRENNSEKMTLKKFSEKWGENAKAMVWGILESNNFSNQFAMVRDLYDLLGLSDEFAKSHEYLKK